MPEAMKLIREELGNDAVILHSKILPTTGLFGRFKKRKIEVLAAIDPAEKEELVSSFLDLQQNLTKQMPTSIKENTVNDQKTIDNNRVKWDDQLGPLNVLVDKVAQSNSSLNVLIPDPISEMLMKLEKQGMDKHILITISSKLLEKWFIGGSSFSTEEVKNWTKELLSQEMVDLPFGELALEKKYINVVGPTGVGKTTTLAKIAADILLKHNKKIGFITTDTYRIAAIEQLKTYANILNAPLEVCYSMEDFKSATQKLAYCDVILVDTAGRNFRNQQYVEDLRTVVDFTEQMDTLLVLSLTAKQTDMEEVLQRFSIIPINQLIFTKSDETSTFGAMMNLMIKYKVGVAYITNGQNVPEDIIAANPKEIVNKICEA